MERRKWLLPCLLLAGGTVMLLAAAAVLWLMLRTAPDTAGLTLVWRPCPGRWPL